MLIKAGALLALGSFLFSFTADSAAVPRQERQIIPQVPASLPGDLASWAVNGSPSVVRHFKLGAAIDGDPVPFRINATTGDAKLAFAGNSEWGMFTLWSDGTVTAQNYSFAISRPTVVGAATWKFRPESEIAAGWYKSNCTIVDDYDPPRLNCVYGDLKEFWYMPTDPEIKVYHAQEGGPLPGLSWLWPLVYEADGTVFYMN
ncbi:hypothetical protein ABW19_dt0207865 [Dactylella cylindrospora]|nr:hypothetical protein ABW19_dt0207865 [Dactylella cylindrospora]